MSNQTWANSRKRYFPLKKENLYNIDDPVSIPHDTDTLFTYVVTLRDEIGTGLSYSSGKFTILNESAAGLYTFDSVITWAIDKTGVRLTYFVKNGERFRRGFNLANPNEDSISDFLGVNTTSVTVNLQVGDELEFFVNQNSKTVMPLDITGTAFNTNVFSLLAVTLLQ